MMRVAIAGTNGFAQYLAYYLETSTPHQFIILSRKPNAGLAAKGWQVIPTNYESFSDLAFLLTGVDVVLSTIAGSSQLALIDAAAAAGVSNFVPSEYRESPLQRAADDPLDDGRAAALVRLRSHAKQRRMQYTIFTFGAFYERFSPDGLAASQIDITHRLGREGDFIADVRRCQASLPAATSPVPMLPPQHDTCVCLTSSRDAARFVIASLEQESLPTEIKFRGQRLKLREVVSICERVRNMPFRVNNHTRSSLVENIHQARQAENASQEVNASQLLCLLEGRLDFPQTTAGFGSDVACETFEDWLRDAWRPILSHS